MFAFLSIALSCVVDVFQWVIPQQRFVGIVRIHCLRTNSESEQARDLIRER